MPNIQAIQIAPTDVSRALTPEQKRFNALINKIEVARATLLAWQDGGAQYGQSYAQAVLPLEDELWEARRQWVFTLDALCEQPGRLTQIERTTASDLVRDRAGALLSSDSSDAELKAVFAKHSVTDFDTEHKEFLRALKGMSEFATGLDLGDDQNITSEDDLLQRLHQGMRARIAAEEEIRETDAPRRRQSAAQKKREAEAQLATQSVREIFRKLASALHPDRETDLAQREIKNALMQEVNQAYARNDLLTLLELQLRIEQVDAGHMAKADSKQVKHYNKVLREQLTELEAQIDAAEMQFRMQFNLEPGWGLNPRKLGGVLESEIKEVRTELTHVRQQIDLFGDVLRTKRWLKKQRKELQMQRAFDELDFADDFF